MELEWERVSNRYMLLYHYKGLISRIVMRLDCNDDLWSVRPMIGCYGPDLPHQYTLEEAKAVAVALVRMNNQLT